MTFTLIAAFAMGLITGASINVSIRRRVINDKADELEAGK